MDLRTFYKMLSQSLLRQVRVLTTRLANVIVVITSQSLLRQVRVLTEWPITAVARVWSQSLLRQVRVLTQYSDLGASAPDVSIPSSSGPRSNGNSINT